MYQRFATRVRICVCLVYVFGVAMEEPKPLELARNCPMNGLNMGILATGYQLLQVMNLANPKESQQTCKHLSFFKTDHLEQGLRELAPHPLR